MYVFRSKQKTICKLYVLYLSLFSFSLSPGLMSAVGALDDYAPVTKYYLASEAVVPGHGYNYELLSNTDSAVDMATEFIVNFATTLAAGDFFHRTPKTLALTDTSLYTDFKGKFDAFVVELTNILKAGNDPNFYAHLHRSRSVSSAFNSFDDIPGTQHNTVRHLLFLNSMVFSEAPSFPLTSILFAFYGLIGCRCWKLLGIL